MKQGPASLKPDFTAETSTEFMGFERPEKLSPEVIDEFVKISSLDIATKFYDATDGLAPIEVQHYQALYKNGWAASPTEEIIRVFGDWATFQDTAAARRSEQLWERWRDKQRILAKADQALAVGTVPAKLFKKVEHFISPEQPRQKVRQSGAIFVENDSGTITEQDVSSDEKITRYCRYKLARDILTSAGKPPSEARLLGLSLGIFLKDIDDESGSLMTALNSELKKASGETISQGAVEIKADSLGMFDYVYPDIRTKMLADIRQASGYKEAEALRPSPEFTYDILNASLIVGHCAIESFIQSGGNPNDLYPLGQLLRSKELNLPTKSSPLATKGMPRSEFISTANWLSETVDPPPRPTEKLLNERVMRNARELGVGFPISRGSRFLSVIGSMTQLYKELGKGGMLRKDYQELNFDEAVKAYGSLASKLGRRPTYDELIVAHTKNPSIPHPQAFNRHFNQDGKTGISALMEAAGQAQPRLEWSEDEWLYWGKKHYEATGGEPTSKVIEEQAKEGRCASRRQFRSIFSGGTLDFRQRVLDLATSEEPLGEELAA